MSPRARDRAARLRRREWEDSRRDQGARPARGCHGDGMEILRWQVGDATVLRIAEVDASAELDGLIQEFDSADVSRAAWLRPHFVDEGGRLKGLVQAFVVLTADK